MRVTDAGRLIYANAASEPLQAAAGLVVGEDLEPDLLARLTGAAAGGQPIELRVGPRTFELLAVPLPELGFTNVYGTDVTAARLIDKFPDLNPNPVLRLEESGVLRYANAASAELRHAIGIDVGEPLPPDLHARLFGVLDGTETSFPEVTDRHGTWMLLPVRIPEIGSINVYGTDITALKTIVKFPDQNPNPVFRITWEGTVVYANKASASLLDGVGAELGQPLPLTIQRELLDAVGRVPPEAVELASRDRHYSLLPVDVPEFGFVNVYGTDITAVRELEALYDENRRLLLNVLPEPIAERLRQGEKLIADRFEDVSLLFADIVGFTGLSSGMTPDELVAVLNEIFTAFDRLADLSGLEKVKTIGDAYMVVGGMTDPRPDHLERVAEMAVALGAAVDGIETAARLGIRFRVGIHCGPVVAGVIGSRKFIYDVWGDTVNVASRMESTSLPGRIHVSALVEERLRETFRFESRGLIDVKGKGAMATFFLLGPAGAADEALTGLSARARARRRPPPR